MEEGHQLTIIDVFCPLNSQQRRRCSGVALRRGEIPQTKTLNDDNDNDNDADRSKSDAGVRGTSTLKEEGRVKLNQMVNK